jgi:hypothetical protein
MLNLPGSRGRGRGAVQARGETLNIGSTAHRESLTMKVAGGLSTGIAIVALAVSLAQAFAQDLAFTPIDEGAKDANWQAYKTRLLDALERKNRQALMAAIDPNVDNGPDIKRGLDEFRRRWDFEQDKSPLWEELRKAVSMGGAYVKGERGQRRFCTPYVAAKWPTSVDPFAFGAITAREVLVKSEPSSDSRTLGTIAHVVVKVEDWEVADTTPGLAQKWTRIRLRDTLGYVPEEQIRSPIEHMACFSGDGGPWRLTSFTAGYLPE